MGLVIEIWYSCSWHRTYFVQEMNEEDAKRKAFEMFKNMSCRLPNTLEEATKDDSFIIEVVAEVDQIIL